MTGMWGGVVAEVDIGHECHDKGMTVSPTLVFLPL